MGIATKRADGAQTSLPGGVRVAKTHPWVDCYGTIAELISQMGLARALSNDPVVNGIGAQHPEVGCSKWAVRSGLGPNPASRSPPEHR
jgi:hypothetical protein